VQMDESVKARLEVAAGAAGGGRDEPLRTEPDASEEMSNNVEQRAHSAQGMD
jgi:hypothetical protein